VKRSMGSREEVSEEVDVKRSVERSVKKSSEESLVACLRGRVSDHPTVNSAAAVAHRCDLAAISRQCRSAESELRGNYCIHRAMEISIGPGMRQGLESASVAALYG